MLLIILFGISHIQSQYEASDWEERDGWMKVSEIFEISKIRSGSYVADIGCQEGYLSVRIVKKVGEPGKVFAVDVKKDRLEKLNEHLKAGNIKNVQTILGDYDNQKLPKNSLDVVIILDTYQEMKDYDKI